MDTRHLERHQMHVRKTTRPDPELATIYQAPNPDPAYPRMTSA